MTPHAFIATWRASALKERSACADRGALHGPREILQLVEPVMVRPLLAEGEREKAAAIAAELERSEAAPARAPGR